MAEHIILETFDSINSMLSTINGRKENSVFAHADKSSLRPDTKGGFHGTATYDEAVNLITTGWDEPLAELKAVARSMNLKTNVTRPKARPTTGIVGYAPCVPNAIMGLPNSMVMTEKTPSKVKAVTIVYSPTDTGGAQTSSYLKSGVAVLKMIHAMELAGYRVRLVAEFKSSREGDEYTFGRVVLKDWREHIDLKKLTFPFANSAMQRRIGFRWMETHPDLQRYGWAGGYGGTVGRRMSYEEQIAFYNAHNLLANGEYFITKQMCEEEEYDTDRIMARAGMKMDVKGGVA